MPDQMKALREYAKLYAEQARLKKELTDVEAQIKDNLPDVLAYMTDNGVQSVNVDGHTIFLKRAINATFLATPEAIEVAVEHGLDAALVTTIHPSRASSIVREAMADLDVNAPLPEWITEAFSVFDRIEPSIRKSAKAGAARPAQE